MRLPQTLPKLSIAAKLYAIFALMATTTVALSAVAVLNARHHAALTASFQASDSSGRAVERVRGLLYAVKLEARGIVMAGSRPIANERAEELGKIVDRINSAMSEWQLNVGTTDAAEFSRLSVQVGDLNGRLSDLVQKAQRAGPEAARAWAEQNHLAPAIEALSGTVKALGQRYVDRAEQTYTGIDEGIGKTASLLTLLAGFALLLAAVGVVILRRSVTEADRRDHARDRSGRRRRCCDRGAVQRAP